MRAIADYSDKWFDIKQTKGSFNCFYVCKAGAVLWECNTLITATEWERLHDDVTATKQRWYCKECHAKYKTKYGVMVEITMGERAFYALAELPSMQIYDAKLMAVQEMYEKYKTPQEFLAALPQIKPLDRNKFLKPTLNPGHFKFNAEMIKDVPKFQWEQLYNLRRVDENTGKSEPRIVPDEEEEC